MNTVLGPRLTSGLLLLLCALASLAGAALAVDAFARTTEPFALGSLRVAVAPARTGEVDIYVPIVDWGVRAAPFEAPVAVRLQFRSLDRDAAREALRSGTAAETTLAELRSDLGDVIRGALLQAAGLAFAGGLVGGFLGGGVAAGLLHRRRWFAYGAAVGVMVPLAVSAVSYAGLRHVDYDAFRQSTFYAHGSELPRLLSFSEQILDAGEAYTQSYEQALAGLANLVSFASRPPEATPAAGSAVVASDLHLNTLVLPALKEHARGKTLFFVGDFTLLGTAYERDLAAEVGRLGERVVAVSGNHDSRPFMTELARSGVIVLTREGRLRADGTLSGRPVIMIDGLRVAGFDDPLERASEAVEEHLLELDDDEFTEAAETLIAWFRALPERPDLVLVHQHGLAHALLDELESGAGPPVLILTGHDHEQHVEQSDANVLVDGGTVGAGGPFAIGVVPVGLAELILTEDGRLDAVDLVEVEPLSGEGTAKRVSIPVAADSAE
jgi:predicted phosphodiesterase